MSVIERAREIDHTQLSKSDQSALKELIEFVERLERDSRVLDVIQFAVERRWQ